MAELSDEKATRVEFRNSENTLISSETRKGSFATRRMPEHTDQNVQGLTSLPTEVLSQILMYTDGSNISTLKQTCKTLRSIIMMRQFWYNRIHGFCQEHLIFPPEEESEEYSIAELEHWTMRRIRARNTCPVNIQVRSQDLPSPTFVGKPFLTPGGRWLLKPHRDLRVFFVDLDSSDLEFHLLLDPKSDDPRVSNYQSFGTRIWIDHKAPRLSFRFQGCLADTKGGTPFTWVYIYQVNLIGHGANATLVAQIVATFRCPKARTRKLLFLNVRNDRYYVRGRKYQSLTDTGLEIFDYRRALGCFDYSKLLDSRTLPLSEDCSTHLEFIDNNVLVTYCHETTSYHIFGVESPTSFKLLHEIKLPEGSCGLSRIYRTSEASLITFYTPINPNMLQRIYGLVIPHDSKLRPWTIKLATFLSRSRDIGFKPGIFISLLCNYQTGTLSRLGHAWDYTCESPDNGPTHTSYLEQKVDQPGLLVAFDEDTGRSVHFDRGRLKVLDIVIAG